MNETVFDPQDVETNKNMVLLTAIIQIFIPILFFLPLVCCKDSQFGKFYANQGLLLLLLYVCSSVLNIIPILGTIAYVVIGIATFVFSIMNAVNVKQVNGKTIPFVGSIELIK